MTRRNGPADLVRILAPDELLAVVRLGCSWSAICLLRNKTQTKFVLLYSGDSIQLVSLPWFVVPLYIYTFCLKA